MKGAGIIFITSDGKILLLKKNNLYETPGGHSYCGESPLKTAIRETKEEVGTVKGKRIKEIKNGNFTLFVYKVDKPFRVKLSKEHSGYKWSDDLKNLHPKLREIFNKKGINKNMNTNEGWLDDRFLGWGERLNEGWGDKLSFPGFRLWGGPKEEDPLDKQIKSVDLASKYGGKAEKRQDIEDDANNAINRLQSRSYAESLFKKILEEMGGYSPQETSWILSYPENSKYVTIWLREHYQFIQRAIINKNNDKANNLSRLALLDLRRNGLPMPGRVISTPPKRTLTAEFEPEEEESFPQMTHPKNLTKLPWEGEPLFGEKPEKRIPDEMPEETKVYWMELKGDKTKTGEIKRREYVVHLYKKYHKEGQDPMSTIKRIAWLTHAKENTIKGHLEKSGIPLTRFG